MVVRAQSRVRRGGLQVAFSGLEPSPVTKAYQPKTTKAKPKQTKQGAEMQGNPWAFHL